MKTKLLLILSLVCAPLSAQVYPDFPRVIPPIQSGSTLPVHCQGGKGEVFLLTSNLTFYGCSATDTWTSIGGSGGVWSDDGTTASTTRIVEINGTLLRGGGTSLPATCGLGDQFFLTSGTTGNYQCTATNTWTLPGGGGGGTTVKPFYSYLPAAKCNQGVPGPAFSLPTSNFPAPNCGGVNLTGGTNRVDAVLSLTATGQGFADHFELPPDQTGAVDLEVVFNSTVTTGAVAFAVTTWCAATGASLDPGAANTPDVFSASAQGTTLFRNVASIAGVNLNSCGAGSELFWKVVLDSSTTATVDASHYVNVFGVRFLVRRNF